MIKDAILFSYSILLLDVISLLDIALAQQVHTTVLYLTGFKNYLSHADDLNML